MKKHPYKQSRAEIRSHLSEQVDFLLASAARFDAGHQSEAKRLATTLRTLLHAPPQARSRALLSQMGSSFTWRLFDSVIAPYNPRNLLNAYHGLAAIRLERTPEGGSAAFVSLLASGVRERPNDKKPFLSWWSDPVIRDSQGTLFGRKQLILAMANQDGGTHVDPLMDPAYAELTRQNSLGLIFSIGDEPRPWANNPVPPSIRQVAQEVLWTLEEQGLARP